MKIEMHKIYEVKEPYYALILAKNEKELREIYKKNVTDSEPMKDFEVKTTEQAAAICQESYEDYVDLCASRGSEYKTVDNYLGNPVILIDGSLI